MRLEAAVPTIEPCPVTDDFVSGLASVQALGPCVRLVFYVDDVLQEAGGAPVRILRRKIVIPRQQVMAMIAGVLALLEIGTDLVAVKH